VLINTRAGKCYGTEHYVSAGFGMGRDATLYLTERGVRITGTDAWSWDTPFEYTRARFEQTGDATLIWEGHKAGRDRAYCHLEKLHQLEKLPGHGFTVACFPVKLRRTSVGWTRAVAILD
jgi:kynurenine formamidase